MYAIKKSKIGQRVREFQRVIVHLWYSDKPL